MTVAEDEALKYYRLKNLMTPPEMIELSELDKEMSNILGRTDISSRQKAVLYYRTLVKFRSLFKDIFPNEKDIFKEESAKEISQIEKEIVKDEEEKGEGDDFENGNGGRQSQSPSEEEDEASDEDEDEDEEEEEEEEEKEKKVILHPGFKKQIASPPGVAFPKKAPPKKKQPSPKKKRKSAVYVRADPETEAVSDFIEKELSKKATQGKLTFEKTPTHVQWQLKSKDRKKYTKDVWDKILGFLLQSKIVSPPKFNTREKPSAVRDIASFLYHSKSIRKSDFENYPNLAHLFEAVPVRRSYTAPEFRPTIKGTGVRVNFKKWEHFLNS